jgi:hypothetical protein
VDDDRDPVAAVVLEVHAGSIQRVPRIRHDGPPI